MPEISGNRTKALLAITLIIAVGAGAAWLLFGKQNDRISEEHQIRSSPTMAASATPEPSSAMSRLSQTADGRFALFAGSEEGEQSMFTIEREDGTRQTYDWSFAHDWGEASPALKYSDLNRDGTDELVVHWTGIASDGDRIENIRVIDAMDFKQYSMPLIEELLAGRISSKVTPLDGYAWITLEIDKQRYEKVMGGQQFAGWGEQIQEGRKLTFHIQEKPDRIYATLDLYAGGGKPGVKLGYLDIDLTVEAGNGARESLLLKPGAIQFQPLNKANNEIPLYAIKAGGGYVALLDWDDETNILQLLGAPKSEKIEQLGPDAATFEGVFVKTLTYDGMELTMYSTEDDRFYVVTMRVNGPEYPTSLDIRVGDPASRVLEKYPYAILAKDGREPPDHYAYAVNDSIYINLYIDIKDGIVDKLSYEYLID